MEHFPQFQRRFLFGPAKAFCASPERVLIDDYDGNVDKFRAAGGHAILVPQSYNSRSHLPISDCLAAIRHYKTYLGANR